MLKNQRILFTAMIIICSGRQICHPRFYRRCESCDSLTCATGGNASFRQPINEQKLMNVAHYSSEITQTICTRRMV